MFGCCSFFCFSQISSAVDTLTGGLFCRLDRNVTLPENKSRELEQNLRQIMESTFKVFFDLVGESVYFLYFDLCVCYFSFSADWLQSCFSQWLFTQSPTVGRSVPVEPIYTKKSTQTNYNLLSYILHSTMNLCWQNCCNKAKPHSVVLKPHGCETHRHTDTQYKSAPCSVIQDRVRRSYIIHYITIKNTKHGCSSCLLKYKQLWSYFLLFLQTLSQC